MVAQCGQGLHGEAFDRWILGGLALALEFGDVLTVVLHHILHISAVEVVSGQLCQRVFDSLIPRAQPLWQADMFLRSYLFELAVGLGVITRPCAARTA